MPSRSRNTRALLTPILLASLLATSAVGCGDDEGAASADEVRSTVARATPGAGRADDGAAVTRRVATTLFPVLADASGDDNFTYSPLSITTALGMARAGATGPSADQLDELLGTSADHPAADALNALDQLLITRSGARKNDSGEDAELTLSAANSLWGQRDATWKAPFLDTLKRSYGVGIHTVDYVGDAEGARRSVNGWVAEQTHDHIPDLIAPGVFDDATRLTLVNALYLAAPWHEAFDPADDLRFTTPSGAVVTAPAMRRSRVFSYQQAPGLQAVTVPYAGGELAMTFVVPDAGRLTEVEASLDDDLLKRLLTPTEPSVVDLTVPRFDLDSRPDLTTALQAVGVTAPFETETDFALMSSDPTVQPLQLAAVIHQATVTIDEKGTVASAATAAVFRATGAPLEPIKLVIDRPFLFVIHDVATATPLFVGRVADPTRP